MFWIQRRWSIVQQILRMKRINKCCCAWGRPSHAAKMSLLRQTSGMVSVNHEMASYYGCFSWWWWWWWNDMSMRGSVDLQAKSENDHPTQLCRAMGCPIYRRIYIRSTDHNCTCTVISGLFCFIPRKSWIVVSGQCHKKDASCTFELHACSSHDHLVLFLTRTILLFILQIIY